MALIHYYKFNGNNFDSVGSFDLVDYSGGNNYATGILGQSIASYSTYPGRKASGKGNALSAWLAADTTESNSGVSEWTITFWLKNTNGGYLQSFVTTSTPNGDTPTITCGYDPKYGLLYVNGIYKSFSLSTWHLVSIRKSGSSVYVAIDSSSETSFSYVPLTTGGKTQFNGIYIGSNGSTPGFYAGQVDDLRLYNTDIGTSGISSIYNSGSPSEASSTALVWDQPIHHYKFTDNLNDSIGSDNGSAIGGLTTYVSGLFTNSPKAAQINSGNEILISAPFGQVWSSGSWSISFYSYATFQSYYPLIELAGISFISGPKSVYWSLGGYASIAASLGNYVKGISFDSIAQRYLTYFYDSVAPISEYSIGSAGVLDQCLLKSSNNGYGYYGPSQYDDLRIYNKSISGFNYLQINNSGNGTEYSTSVSPDGPASGSLATITMSGPAGSASSGSPGSASGLLATITVSAFSGIGAVNVTGSGSIATITMSAPTGIAFPEFIGTGSLSTVSVIPIEAVASISTSIQLSYVACDAEIGWKQSLPVTGFASAVQGEDAISARITPVVSGTEANIVFFEQRTLTASSSYTYDLQSLTDFLGQSFSLSRAYAISVVMTSGSATISPGTANPLKWFFNSNTANVTITSGNSFLFAQKASAIVSGSAKTILVTNPSGLSACVFKIAILGGR